MGPFLALIALVVIIVIYFVPSLEAFYSKKGRKKHAEAIFVLNVFLGWTLLGWVAAAVWATADEPINPVAKPLRPDGSPSNLEFDRPNWMALVQYDADIAAAEKEVRPLGQEWVDELASAYMALGDKAYLREIVQKLRNRAESTARAKGIEERRVSELSRAKAEKTERFEKKLPWLFGGFIVVLVVGFSIYFWANGYALHAPSREDQKKDAAALVSLLKDQEYPTAREVLRSKGWTPVRVFSCTGDEAECSPPEKFPEVQSCSGWFCHYTWRRQGALISVDTENDAPNPDTVINVTVCTSADSC